MQANARCWPSPTSNPHPLTHTHTHHPLTHTHTEPHPTPSHPPPPPPPHHWGQAVPTCDPPPITLCGTHQWYKLGAPHQPECSQNTNALAYKTLIRPSLPEYASCVWDPFQTNHIHRLEGVQSKAASFFTGQDRWQTNVTALLNDLHSEVVTGTPPSCRLTMLYKTIHEQAACVIPPYFPHCGFSSAHHTGPASERDTNTSSPSQLNA